MSETKLFPARIGAALVKSIFQFNRLRNHTSDVDHKVLLFSGAIVGADDGGDVIETTANLTLDCTTVGINGLDAGALGASTWYAIYLIKQPGGDVASLASTSFTAPTLPAGYVFKRIVGAIRTDGSSNFQRIEQVDRYVVYTGISGIYTTGFPGVLTDENLTSFVSPVSRRALIGFRIYCYDGDKGAYYYAPAALYAAGSKAFLGLEMQAHDDNDNTRGINAIWLPVDENQHICIGANGNRKDSDVRVQGYTIDS